MRKKISKLAAIVACVGILSLSAPFISAADAKAPQFNFKVLVKNPVAFFSALLSFLPIFDNGKTVASSDSNGSNGKVKITGGLQSDRLGNGD